MLGVYKIVLCRHKPLKDYEKPIHILKFLTHAEVVPESPSKCVVTLLRTVNKFPTQHASQHQIQIEQNLEHKGNHGTVKKDCSSSQIDDKLCVV